MKALKKLNSVSKESDFLWNYSIYKVKQHSIYLLQWFEVFEQIASHLEKHILAFLESF